MTYPVQKATKESNRDLPQPVAAPEECSSNSATLSRSLATSSSKAASLSSNGSDDMPGGGAFGGTRPGCACDDVPDGGGLRRDAPFRVCHKGQGHASQRRFSSVSNHQRLICVVALDRHDTCCISESHVLHPAHWLPALSSVRHEDQGHVSQWLFASPS